jgi:hypothetical protein
MTKELTFINGLLTSTSGSSLSGSSVVGARPYTFINGFLTNVGQVIPDTTGAQLQMQFNNGLLVGYYINSGSFSGSSGSSSGSSGSVVPSVYGEFSYWDSFANWYSMPDPQPATSYLGNGILQMTEFSGGFAVYGEFYFRLKYLGAAGISGTLNIDITHLSGTPKIGLWYSPPFSDGYNFTGIPFFNAYTNTLTQGGLTLYGWGNWTSGSSLYATHRSSMTVPALSYGDERWIAFDVYPNLQEIVGNAQWQIDSIFVRPTGTSGESDIILWNKA